MWLEHQTNKVKGRWKGGEWNAHGVECKKKWSGYQIGDSASTRMLPSICTHVNGHGLCSQSWLEHRTNKVKGRWKGGEWNAHGVKGKKKCSGYQIGDSADMYGAVYWFG